MSVADNKQLILDYFDTATGKRNDRPIEDFFSAEAIWHVPQSNPDIKPNPKVGHAEVMDVLTSGVGIYRSGSMTVNLEKLIADDDHVVAQFVLDATLANGNDYHNRYVFIFRVRDGRINEVWEHLDTLYQWRQGTFDHLD